jgi:hypothetical protein
MGIAEEFQAIVETYVADRYGKRTPRPSSRSVAIKSAS